jgi:predicted phage terminase large subunit-like protein
MPQCDEVIQAWDLNFGKKVEDINASYVSGQCWGKIGSNYYLMDSVRGQWNHAQNKRQVLMLHSKWASSCKAVYIEDAASGAPLVSDLKGLVPGLILVKPIGSKISRFESVTPLFEAGQVHVPEQRHQWVKDWTEEIVSFPGSSHNDQVDVAAMALTRLTARRDYSKFKSPSGGTRTPQRLR